MAASGARSFLGAGRVLADVFVGGAPTGRYIPFEEVGKFEIKPNSELKNQTSKSRLQYAQIIETVAIPQPSEFSMTLREVNAGSLRLAYMAEDEVINVAGAAVTDEVVVAHVGQFVQLANRNLSETGFVLTNSGATVTYVYGTDYEVNWRFGLLRALVGGAIADAASLKVDYTAIGQSGTRLKGGMRSSIRAKLLFDGVNMVDDSPALCTVWEVLLTPTGAVDLMSDDWVEVELQGSMKTPAGKESPFELDLLDLVPA